MRIKNLGYNGIYLPDADVLLDGSGPDAPTFITHAHSDHVPRNRRQPVFASPATAALMRARGHTGPIEELPFGERLSLTGPRKTGVTLYPAGHILGSAMVYVETENGSLLYTGDCRTPPSPVSEGFGLPELPVDFLIIEATFALPIYKWEPYEVLFSQIREFAATALREGATPVLLCYNLGKAQLVMHALASSEPSVTVQIHGGGEKLCQVYEQFGVDLGSWEPYDAETLAGKVLITPSSSLDTPMIGNIRKQRIAYVSGWASLEARASQSLADTLIPLSDHLDFFELLDVCRTLRPRHTWLTHSPDPTVALHYLREDGLSCSSLEEEREDAG
jgi:putative mRNA 3-end processing factor